jgi:hypothetical protein
MAASILDHYDPSHVERKLRHTEFVYRARRAVRPLSKTFGWSFGISGTNQQAVSPFRVAFSERQLTSTLHVARALRQSINRTSEWLIRGI